MQSCGGIPTMEYAKHQKSKADSKKFTVAVEGNIGCGKTTLLQYFARFPNVQVLQEPVDQWRNMEGHNLLNMMYHDPERWTSTFQSYVQLTMAKLHLKKHEDFERVKLMERSIYSARYCFVENHYKSGKMSKPDYIVLDKWFQFLTSDSNLHPDLTVYIQTSPETVYRNIQTRGREEEKGIPMEYLNSLHDLHEKWLIEQTYEVPCPVLVLHGDCSVAGLEELCRKNTNEILFTRRTE